MLYPEGMDLFDYKVVVVKSLIGLFNNRSQSATATYLSRRSCLPAEKLIHLLVIQSVWAKYRHCYMTGIKNKTYYHCKTCGL